MSAQPCGCDPEERHECEEHEMKRRGLTAHVFPPVSSGGVGALCQRCRKSAIYLVANPQPCIAETPYLQFGD